MTDAHLHLVDFIQESDELLLLLERFDNLNVDHSWLVFDVLICPQGQPDAVWLGRNESSSERICLGSDIFGSFDRLAHTVARYTPFLGALSDKAWRDPTTNMARCLYDEPALIEPNQSRPIIPDEITQAPFIRSLTLGLTCPIILLVGELAN